MKPDDGLGEPAPSLSGGYWQLLRGNAQFRRLYTAQAISFAGDWFVTVPLLGLILELTDSALMVSVVLTAQRLAAFLAAPLAGVVADRFKRKYIIISADLIRVVAAAGLVLVDDLDSPGLAIVLVVVLGIGMSFHFPATRSALPNLVTGAELARANVLYGSAWGLMSAVGAVIGGAAAVTFGRDTAFLIDAVSFAGSALLVAGIRSPFEGAREARSGGALKGISEGIAAARRSSPIMALLVAKTGYSLLSGGIVALYPVIAEVEFDAGDFGTGVLYAAQGFGSFIGPTIIERTYRGRDLRLLGSLGIAIGGWGVVTGFIAIAPTLLLTALTIGIGRMGGGVTWTFSALGFQRLAGDDIRGRIFSLDFGLMTLGTSLSFIIFGAALDFFSIEVVVIAAAIVAVVFGAVWHIATRAMWNLVGRGAE